MTLFFYRSVLFSFMLTGALFINKPAPPHPIHVSTTDISYNPQDNKLEVICTIFTDDLEAALEKQYHTKIDLTKPEMHAAMDTYVKNYMSINEHIKADTKPLAFYYIGYEINREAVNVYFESEKTPQPKRIDAEVSLLHNLFTDQINIVHMTVNGTRKSEKLDYPDKNVMQVF